MKPFKIIIEIKKTGLKGIDGAMNIIWYESQIKRLGKGKVPKPDLNPWAVFLNYFWLILEQKLKRIKKPVSNNMCIA